MMGIFFVFKSTFIFTYTYILISILLYRGRNTEDTFMCIFPHAHTHPPTHIHTHAHRVILLKLIPLNYFEEIFRFIQTKEAKY